MPDLEPGAIVVLHCTAPKEKMWGLLLRLDAVGVVVRGMDLGSVEDWLRQEASGAERTLGPSTFLVPTHRVVRLDLDESGPMVAGYADRFRSATGRTVHEVLAGPATFAGPADGRDVEVQ